MSEDLLLKFMETLALLMCPITPHWSEKCWALLGKEGLIVTAPFPGGEGDGEDKLLTRESQFLFANLKSFRQTTGKSKKKVAEAYIIVPEAYPDWKVESLKWLHKIVREEESHGVRGK